MVAQLARQIAHPAADPWRTILRLPRGRPERVLRNLQARKQQVASPKTSIRANDYGERQGEDRANPNLSPSSGFKPLFGQGLAQISEISVRQ